MAVFAEQKNVSGADVHALASVRSRLARVLTLACALSIVMMISLGGCDDRANPTPAPAPTKAEPSKTEPSKPEPSKPEPSKSEPSKPEPAKTEPSQPEPSKPEPAKPAQPAQADPNIVVNKNLPTTDATIGGKKFKLEVAATPETRMIGMMGRTSIADGTGLLFVFPPSMFGVQSFWMNNCLTDMDILYLDNSGRILTMHTMTKPEPKKPEQSQAAYEASLKRYSSRYPCGLAIEIAPGEAKKLGLKEGDLVKLDVPALKKMAK